VFSPGFVVVCSAGWCRWWVSGLSLVSLRGHSPAGSSWCSAPGIPPLWGSGRVGWGG
jgi:hypothetical protein